MLVDSFPLIHFTDGEDHRLWSWTALNLGPLSLLCSLGRFSETLSLGFLTCGREVIIYLHGGLWASLVAQTVKNLPVIQETCVQSLGQEDPLEKGTATHSSILAWRIPWIEDPGGLQSTGSKRVGLN